MIAPPTSIQAISAADFEYRSKIVDGLATASLALQLNKFLIRMAPVVRRDSLAMKLLTRRESRSASYNSSQADRSPHVG